MSLTDWIATKGLSPWFANWVGALTEGETRIAAVEASVNGAASTSASSILIGTGAKGPFAIDQAGRTFKQNATYLLSVPGTTNFMIGDVIADATSAPSFNVRIVNGSGTFASWEIAVVTGTILPKGLLTKTASFAASAGLRYGVDTTSGIITGTLPASPAVGDPPIHFVDAQMKWGTNNFTIGRSGNNINGFAADFSANSSFAYPISLRAEWFGGATGWGVSFA